MRCGTCSSSRRQWRESSLPCTPGVISILRRHPDDLVRLKFDKLEVSGADRTTAHITGTDMAGIDRRPTRGQQCQKRRLRPLQPEGDLEVAIDGHLLDIAVPGFARIDAKFLSRLAAQEIPGTFDILRRKGLPIVPFDA